MRRRLFCLLPLALVTACADTAPQPVTTDPAPQEPERVYSPGPISWDQLSEEHRRRARVMLARQGEAVPDDEEALRARWEAMSPAQQRFVIRRPQPMSPPRDAGTPARGSARGTARGTSRGGAAPARRTGTTRAATPRSATPPPSRRAPSR